MPRRHTLPPQQIRIKPDQLSSSPPSPFKNILPDNNEKKSDNAGSKELDGGRYLHKKFKKVATLEEVPEVAACGGDEALERASGAGSEIDGPVAPAQGRYVCPYCAMPCAKPSVLQKHIRAHTNERPYPCRPCGFAFKTKSNLYKHCRSRSHTLKMDVADCCTNPSSEEDDSRHSSCPAAEDDDRPNCKNKIYKPKFHTLQGESSEGRDSSPSPDFLRYRINRLICEGDSELMDHPVPRQSWNPPRSSPLEKEDSPEAASPFPSKLALALLRPGTTSIEPQPLNLSQKESSACGGDPTHTIDGSIIKDILLRARSGLNGFKENTVGYVECPDCKAVVDKLDIHLRVGCRAQLENSRHQQFSPIESNYDYAPVSSRTPEAHPLLIRMEKPPDLASLSRLPIDGSRPVEAPPPLTPLTDLSATPRIVDSSPSMGKSPECSTVLSKPCDSMPVLGKTSLVEPAEKKRKLSPRPACLPDLIPTTESPQKSIRLFGGQVKILDGPGGEARTLRIESGRESPPLHQEPRDPKDRRVLTISNTGLHSVGLTVIQSDCETTRKPSESLNGKIAIPILSNIPRNLDPLTTITAYNPLTLPPRSSDVVQPLTIVHGGKPIPHVPGMPGPNSLLDPPSLIRKPLDQHATTPTHSIRQEPLESHVPSSAEDMLTRASVVSPIPITSTSPQPNCTESSEKKFIRPTWLPLKTGTFVAKKPLGALGLGPPPVALVSPETPRPRKSYGQLYLNGHAYTYLGLKCSSRMFFCTLNKPQPIYVPLSPEHSTLSMYSNWKVVSESALSPLGLSPVCVMSSYDSRNRSSSFCQAGTAKCQVVHSSYSQTQSSSTSLLLASSPSQMKEMQILDDEDPKRLKICNGGYESTEDYVYIRGRGRGKYVCEECGVRCCKPSMLKKHIRTTHSDLRPYSCKHCSFSFKTKGNLTKHMKSKAHYKQCIDLDISPVPTTVTDVNIDHESLARQNARCKELGADIEGSSEETEEEDEEEELPESEDEEGKIEREAAASLLSLSEVAQQSALKDYANLGLISTSARPLTYPYSLPTVIRKSSSSERDDNQDEPLELTASSQSSHSSDITTPIDLSNKTSSEGSIKSFETDTSMLSMLSTPIATLSALSPVLPSPLGTPSVISDEGCALMTAYLKEKAARDTLMKQQQYRSNSSSLRLSLTEERCLMLDSPSISISERNRSPMSITSMSVDSRPVDCRFSVRNEGFRPIEKKTPTDCGRPVVEKRPIDSHNQSVESKKLLIDGHIRPIESHKLLIDSHRSMDSHNQLVDSQNRPVDSQRMPLKIVSRPIDVIVRPMEQIRPESQENMGASTSDSEAMEVDVESMDQSPVDHQDKRSEECQTPTAVPSVSVNHSAKESALGILALTSSQAAKTPASILPPQSKLKAEFLPPSSGPNYINVLEEGRSICAICQKVFTKPSQLRLHVNIHYFERPFRCDACGVSFRTKGHLQKHQRSISHLNKVNMNSTFGTATMSNPRPFKCTDCKIAFRIHGHLAKHLRSKMHIMRLECLGKLPFGMYAELERSGLNIHDIDTTDCHNSLESLQLLARKLHENDPTKLGQWAAPVEMMGQGGMDGGAMDMPASAGETSSDEDEPSPASFSQLTPSHSIQR